MDYHHIIKHVDVFDLIIWLQILIIVPGYVAELTAQVFKLREEFPTYAAAKASCDTYETPPPVAPKVSDEDKEILISEYIRRKNQ